MILKSHSPGAGGGLLLLSTEIKIWPSNILSNDKSHKQIAATDLEMRIFEAQRACVGLPEFMDCTEIIEHAQMCIDVENVFTVLF